MPVMVHQCFVALVGSDIERGSLGTPSSASTYSIASGSIPSLHIEPEPTVQ